MVADPRRQSQREPEVDVVNRTSPPHELLATQWQLVRRQLPPDQRVVLPMLSGSMAPLLPVGAEIEVAPVVDPSRIGVGDIVVFRRGERLVAHRLLLSWGLGPNRWFLERGDGVGSPGRVAARDILGLVVAVQDGDDHRTDLRTPRALRTARQSVRRSLRRWLRDLWQGTRR